MQCSKRLTSRDTTFDDFEVEIGPTGHRFDAKAEASASKIVSQRPKTSGRGPTADESRKTLGRAFACQQRTFPFFAPRFDGNPENIEESHRLEVQVF